MAGSLFATDAQDSARGFSSNAPFQSGGIDNINVFNGNLTIRVPVAPSYPLNGSGSYAIGLVFNGQPWDFVDDPGHGKVPTPNRRSNAGIGWRVSLGRLIVPNDITNSSFNGQSWLYESPDGGDHIFYGADFPFVTRDSTYLRLRSIDADNLEVDFPDGMTHRFDKNTGELVHIRTRFETAASPAVTISNKTVTGTDGTALCKDAGAKSCWEIQDRFSRKQYVTFEDDAHLHYGKRARKIILTWVGSTSVTYELAFKNAGSFDLPVDASQCYLRSITTPASWPVPLLDSVTLPDGSKYSFTYHVTTPSECSQGSMKEMTLPALGTVAYTYQNYTAGLSEVEKPWVPGVRTATRSDRTNSGTWTYDVVADVEEGYSQEGTEKEELSVTVVSPDCSPGSTTACAKVKNYFSIAKHNSITDPAWKKSEYGLPFTHRAGTDRTDAGKKKYLSTQIIDRDGTISRSTYVLYEDDGFVTTSAHAGDNNHRVAASTLRFNSDGDKTISAENTDFDSFGHYRTTKTTPSGFLENFVRTATVHHTPLTSSLWFLDAFDYRTVTDTSSPSKTFRTEACFDATNGFLKAARRLASTDGATTGSDDVITLFKNDDNNGNVTKEQTYAASVGDLCAASTSSPLVEMRHTYDFGTRKTSTYYHSNGTAHDFKSLDLTLDTVSAPTADADVSGHATGFEYDTVPRLKSTTPPNDTKVDYAFNIATASTNALVTAKQTASGGDEKKTTSEFDGAGRVIKESRVVPDGTTTRTTEWDVMGRKRKASEWDFAASPAHQTTLEYDEYGRVTKATLPDSKESSTSYTGGSKVARTVKVSSGAGGALADAVTTEEYDAYGRLLKVTEPNGTVTTYGYDAADHLVNVCVNSASCQNRTFTYDGRGFLTEELHPENGTTRYTYDARGHVLKKQVGTSPSTSDLRFTYDDAERLLTVERRISDSQYETLKSFEYGISGNAKGRLTSATRHNRVNGDIKVVETYTYDASSRLTQTQTEIFKDTASLKVLTSAQSYDTFGEPLVTTYPNCTNCGGPGASTVTQTFSKGVLTGVQNWADLTYSASGMVTAVKHKDAGGTLSTTDTYVEDSGMPRPKSIAFDPYSACTTPHIDTPPAGTSVPSGSTATLTVSGSGSGALHYQWYSGAGALIDQATSSSYQTPPITSQSTFYVVIYNSCGRTQSATVTVSICNGPTINTQPSSPTINPGGSATLTVAATGSPTHYQWYIGSSGDTSQPIPNNDNGSYPTGSLNVTTRYWVMVTNDCGGAASSITAVVTVPLAAPALSVSMAANGATWRATLTWSASPNAHHYEVYRFGDGSDFLLLTAPAALTVFEDFSAGKIHAYRVRAVDSVGGSASPFSNTRLGTAIAFATINTGTVIAASQFNEILAGINALRVAGPHNSTTWTAILPANIPAPASGGLVYAAQLTSLRSALDLARSWVAGVPALAYSNVGPGSPIVASNLQQLQGGLQ